MYTRIIEDPALTVKLLLKKREKTLISFEDCIEIKYNTKSMPKLPLFRVIDRKMYTKTKLSSYDNIVKMIVFTFKKKVSDSMLGGFLKKHLPTLFDYKVIVQRNWDFCAYQFKDHIVDAAISILGKKEVAEIEVIKQLISVSTPEECHSEESSILDEISEVCSEEMLAL